MAMSDAILTRLLALHPKIIDLKLDRMWRLLDRLGNPGAPVPPVIHVAGTNGKGSTLAYLPGHPGGGRALRSMSTPRRISSSFMSASGSAGQVTATLISEPDLIALLDECEAANAGEPITFFEITTAAAFLAFARNPADYLLLEVGLGGRLDATNVIARPRATVITTIDYDHQQYLGTPLPPSPPRRPASSRRACRASWRPSPTRPSTPSSHEARRRAVPP